MKTQPRSACPACGASVEPGQEYCLHCGGRIVPARRLGALGQAWERRLGRYPGDWVWTSLLLALVAAGSATAGIVTSGRSGPSRGSQTIVATSPVVTAPPVTTVTAPPTRPRPTAPPTPAPVPTPRTALTEWPARNGYTVVIASIPARGTGRDDAIAKAKAVLAGGVRDVGVLVSAGFASLHPGYYVVFAGIYGSLQDAQTAAGRLSSRFPNAYARQIAR